eukprot:scaffold136898_cov16-Tisochrysis_lutea.AAC.1
MWSPTSHFPFMSSQLKALGLGFSFSRARHAASTSALSSSLALTPRFKGLMMARSYTCRQQEREIKCRTFSRLSFRNKEHQVRWFPELECQMILAAYASSNAKLFKSGS